MRNFLLFLHIVGAGTWLGANFTQAAVGRKLLTTSAQVAAAWTRSLEVLSRRLYNVTGILVLLSGIALVLVSDGAYSFTDAFVLVGVAMLIAGGAIGGGVLGRGNKRAAELYEEGGQSAELPPLQKRLVAWGVIDTVLLLLTILAMVYRWQV
jgi:hypothetical protein